MNILYWNGHCLSINGKRLASKKRGGVNLPPSSYFDLDKKGLFPAALLFPMEFFLIRIVEIPLRSVRFVDEHVIAHALQDEISQSLDRWSLAWELIEIDGKVKGVVVGMPVELKGAVDNDPLWQRCVYIGMDGALCLYPYLNGRRRDQCHVLHEDRDGLFLGVFRSGACSGIRRINRTGYIEDADVYYEEVIRTLSDMEYEPGESVIVGRIGRELADYLNNRADTDLISKKHLGERLELVGNATVKGVGLNFRKRGFLLGGESLPSPKVLSFLLLFLCICILWSRDVYRKYSLDKAVEKYTEIIVSEFHRALPGEVVVDPLLQLKKAVKNRKKRENGPWGGLLKIGKLLRAFPGVQVVEIDYDWKNKKYEASFRGQDDASLDALRRQFGQHKVIEKVPFDGGIKLSIRWGVE